MSQTNESGAVSRDGFPWLRVLALVVVVGVLTTVTTVWAIKTYVFPTQFEAVTLSAGEEKVLDRKLARLNPGGGGARPGRTGSEGLEPEPYREDDGARRIAMTERELNALLARNTDLAERLAIDLSGDLLSALLLVPVPEDFPMLGGRTIKVRAGLELAYRDKRPIVALQGVSVMGVPIPSSWLGGLKHVDLVEEYGGKDGAWKSFADGIKDLKVEEGSLTIELEE